ncbi:DUF1419 domain-containing protein [Agrobacterium tumefaciens]|uniref:DUF1419 domain-containing protein n=2 Tax=Rhizobium/Agrobacterium group TaxID=227290 RepID=Q9KW93_RHIRH|nr:MULTISPECIES: DUF1419 domain-containing protein [Rhizobium/Agrobacterium group]ASK42972.1 hypothetical protein [Rhizobium rhizogenes]MCZ7977378.1 DUF1419 domain-containing protein [Agrobacterium salinitolerans]MDA5243187.1 DUF1419 domain-containing protein [Agrobacterium sp. MAFF310724]MDA5247631.1 DUF1419 domain-containing protein [Agrobacterium sp. MAFF210268]TRB03299.1 DUF1419 domain-containing protein [Agrobacterium tumefaciens]
MNPSPAIRKVFQGVASRQQMFRMFDRHAQRPNRWDGDASPLYAGEWFEIGEAEHDYMFEILPPLWIRGSMFAMREFLTGSVTSVFFALRIDGAIRHFHGYCDISDRESVERMRVEIIERESRPVRAMTREERLEHIWSITVEDYRGYAGDRWPGAARGTRTIMLYDGAAGGTLKLLDELTDDEIAAKLPVQLRHLPSSIAA